jgi:hypothetical protein
VGSVTHLRFRVAKGANGAEKVVNEMSEGG